ncbi:fibronectin type III domain-containing protein, partial [Microbulbifer thermotolerans]|uniref:fibronectin type III domain-containing protein n=1 Tax=Microbulbifer thermotolerans TaxID=252514 RepID=UPI001C313125
TVLQAKADAESVTLTWEDTGADSYNLFYSTAPGCDIENYASCPGGTMVAGAESPYTVTGLTNGQNYWFQVESVVETSRAVSNEAGARPDRLVPNDRINAMATGTDGTVYLGGYFTYFGVLSGHGVPFSTTSGYAGAFPLVNGPVTAVAGDNKGGFYIGGEFTTVGGEARNNLAYIRADGTLGDWNPTIDGNINALAVLDDTVYIGGDFDKVNGQPRINLAAIDADGNLLEWRPAANSNVNAIAIADGTIYVGGDFSNIDGETHDALAAINTDGSLHDWSLDFDRQVHDLAVSGDTIYVTGNFKKINEQTHNGVAAVDTNGNLLDWNPGIGAFYCTTQCSIAVAEDTIFIGWDSPFVSINGETRNYLAAFDSSGNLLDWSPNPNFDVYAITVVGDTVYVGGKFTSIDGQERNSLAAIDTDGNLLDWSPATHGGPTAGVTALAVSDDTVYAGGDFTSVQGYARNRLAAIDSEGQLLPWSPSADGNVKALAVDGNTVYAGGNFESINGEECHALAAIDTSDTLLSCDWDINMGPEEKGTVYALTLAENTLYVGGYFSNFNEQTRNNAAAISTTDGSLLTWNPDVSSDVSSIFSSVVRTIAISGDTVILGGKFSSVNEQPRENLAAINTDGSLLDWTLDADQWIYTSIIHNNTIYIGGRFSSIGGISRNYIAAINTDGSLADSNPDINGPVFVLTENNGTLYAGGDFDTVNGKPRSYLAAFDSDNTLLDLGSSLSDGAYSLTVSGNSLYLAGYFTEVNGEFSPHFAILPLAGSATD